VADKTITFEGETFTLQTGPLNEFLYMQFMAFISDFGPDADVPWGLLVKLLKASIVPGEWRRFEKRGERTENFMEKSLKVLEARMEVPVEEATGHPTGQPSVSTDGPKVTEPKSVTNFDVNIWEKSGGRIDRYYMLKAAHDSQLARSA
jgi:hypothetical protein